MLRHFYDTILFIVGLFIVGASLLLTACGDTDSDSPLITADSALDQNQTPETTTPSQDAATPPPSSTAPSPDTTAPPPSSIAPFPDTITPPPSSPAPPQATNKTLQLNWDPNPANDAVLGYIVYYGSTKITATQEISNLSIGSGNIDPNAPAVSYNTNDLGLVMGDPICFSFQAYNLAGTSTLSAPICTTI